MRKFIYTLFVSMFLLGLASCGEAVNNKNEKKEANLNYLIGNYTAKFEPEYLFGEWCKSEMKLNIKKRGGKFYYIFNSRFFQRKNKYDSWKENYQLQKKETGTISTEIFQDDVLKDLFFCKIKSGDFEERGAYIPIYSEDGTYLNNWKKEPKKIQIMFEKGRGKTIVFRKEKSKNVKEKKQIKSRSSAIDTLKKNKRKPSESIKNISIESIKKDVDNENNNESKINSRQKGEWQIDDPDGYTNIRSDKTVKSPVLFVLYDNQFFEIIDKSGSWWKIKYKDKYGYIHKSRVKKAY